MRQKLRFKSLIAVILAITMLLTVLPVQTFAADTDPAAAASAADTSADAGQDDAADANTGAEADATQPDDAQADAAAAQSGLAPVAPAA